MSDSQDLHDSTPEAAEPPAAVPPVAVPATTVPATPAPRQDSAYAPFDPRQKSPLLASFLSLMPGLGQVYIGYYQRGFVHALIAASVIAILAADVLDDLIPVFALFLAFFWLYNVVDAGRRAAFYNQAVAEGGAFKPVELPGDAIVPGPQGSLIGGTVLVVVGFALLLHTRFGISLDWVEDWWPVAPMVLGCYLIYLALAERREMATVE